MTETIEDTYRKKVVIIDSNSLMHRAFHAIPPTMSTKDGQPTNAVFGFVSMFVKMMDQLHPDGVICAFDKGKPARRIELLPAYKAQRPPTDPDLKSQFALVKEILVAMNVPIVEAQGWEGDDILGTLGARGEKLGCDMYLVTGDRDAYQLATEHVKIVATKKGLSQIVIYGPEEVKALYEGVSPEQIPEFYGLKGDSSDNIPGVRGIGPKRASQLIVEYGDIENLLAHGDEIKGKMGENLRASADDARVSRDVAIIRLDAPVDIDPSEPVIGDFDPEKVREAFEKLGFKQLLPRVLAIGIGASELAPAASLQAIQVPTIVDFEAGEKLLQEAYAGGLWIAAAYEDAEADAGLFAEAPGLFLAIEGKDSVVKVPGEISHQVLKDILLNGQLVSFTTKKLLGSLMPGDSSEPASILYTDIDSSRLFDCGLAAYILDSSIGKSEIKDMLENHGGLVLDKGFEKEAVAISEAIAAIYLRPILFDLLEKDQSLDCFIEIEMPLVPVLLQMERNGMAVDVNVLKKQSKMLEGEMQKLTDAILEEAGEDFNIDSPTQLSHILFDVLEFPHKGIKKTKRGYYSTNASVLDDLSKEHEIVRNVLAYREKAKLKSTYLDAIPGLIAGDGRIHTTYNQAVTTTGRLSSSDPNLQNIPVRSELGKHVREGFIAPEGCVIVTSDYSQIELRLLAHLSGDEHLIEAFCNGEDFHAQTASRVFDVDIQDVTPLMRSRAKAVNFGIVYGQQAYGLSQTLDIPFGEAQGMIDRYFQAYPRVREYLDEIVDSAKKTGYAVTMFGRKRHVPDIHSRNPNVRGFGERTAMNHPMQGSAADIIKLAMNRVMDELKEGDFKSKLILQVHDELDFEVPEDEVARLSEMIVRVMENAATLSVPMNVSVSVGKNWAEAK